MIAPNRFGMAVELLQDIAPIDPCLSRVGVERDGFPETGQSFFQAPAFMQGGTTDA
jgi:hypothetical protein